jgi:hypothetical protein
MVENPLDRYDKSSRQVIKKMEPAWKTYDYRSILSMTPGFRENPRIHLDLGALDRCTN